MHASTACGKKTKRREDDKYGVIKTYRKLQRINGHTFCCSLISFGLCIIINVAAASCDAFSKWKYELISVRFLSTLRNGWEMSVWRLLDFCFWKTSWYRLRIYINRQRMACWMWRLPPVGLGEFFDATVKLQSAFIWNHLELHSKWSPNVTVCARNLSLDIDVKFSDCENVCVCAVCAEEENSRKTLSNNNALGVAAAFAFFVAFCVWYCRVHCTQREVGREVYAARDTILPCDLSSNVTFVIKLFIPYSINASDQTWHGRNATSSAWSIAIYLISVPSSWYDRLPCHKSITRHWFFSARVGYTTLYCRHSTY